MIDNEAPQNSYAPSVQGSKKTFKSGDVMKIAIQVSEKITVKDSAKPYIEMNYKTDPTAADNNRWIFDSIETSGNKSTLYFTYTVKEEDSLKNGELNDTKNWKIYMQDGDIVDAAGNNMKAELKAVSAWVNPFKGIYFDSAAPVWEYGAALVLKNVEGEKNISITRPDAIDDNSGLSSSPSPYTLYRQEKDSKEEPETVTTFSSGKKDYKDTTVAEDTTYIYTLAAQDKCGNKSELLTAEIKTADSFGQMDDTEAPYWDSDTRLNITRKTEDTAVASWDRSKAHDDVSSIKEFRLYIKKGFLSGWELVGAVDGTKESLEITGLELDKDYAFRLEAVDAGRNNLESENGPQAELEEAFPMMVIQDQDGNNIKQFIDGEILDNEFTQSRFSSINNQGNRAYYAAAGIDVSQLLKKAGVKDYTYVNIKSSDRSAEKTFTKAQVEGENSWYYSPQYDGINVKAQQVKPMVVFSYTEDSSAEPDYGIGGENVPRLFFGQTSIDHINRPYFVKDVYYITVNTVEKTIGFAESEVYKTDTASQLPTVVAVKDKDGAKITASVDSRKYNSDTISVNMIQMCGNKMVEIISAEKSNAGDSKVDPEVSATFDLKEGDKVSVIVTDKLDGIKGSAAEILTEKDISDTPEIKLTDVYLKNTNTASIKGNAKAESWVSVKVTDKDNNIVYFNGSFADSEGAFHIDADLEGISRPLDITVTNGKSVKTAGVYDYDELKLSDGIKTTWQYAAGKKASAIDSGITGMKVTYQWYSNTRKSNTGGTAIANAVKKTYVPSISRAGVKYYYAVARDMEGNTLKTPVFTVKASAKAPVAKAVSRSQSSIRITWTASSPGVSNYKVYRATKKTGTYKLLKITKSRSLTNIKLVFNKNYYYKVTAVSSGGNGTSKIVYAKPVPAKTSITKLTKKSKTSMQVKWKKVSGATGYKIAYSTNKNLKKGTVKTCIVKKNTYKTLYKLKKGKKYYIKVKAYKLYKGTKVYGPYSTVKVK